MVKGEDGNAGHEAEESTGEGAAQDEGSLVEGGGLMSIGGDTVERGLFDVNR